MRFSARSFTLVRNSSASASSSFVSTPRRTVPFMGLDETFLSEVTDKNLSGEEQHTAKSEVPEDTSKKAAYGAGFVFRSV
eukprot:CAMPEP_0184557902 /NCGR_PEP_ID=MMETSP0199_2-20130426/44031_1 /TAXON_ID=1112570 /ORGANISM="Thraustochytrium sp., Strain LLF1b" /LENGTH=79 /DNA_ID=CAMNT_0026954939 /DNA_START=322 /DNA_END=564 /DNA_ORIENTATION=+